VKNATLTQGLFTALLLAGGTAGADTQYPSGFEPAPVFEDEGLAGKYSPPKTPPTAVEQAKPQTEQSRPAAKAEPGRPDAGQPAKQSPTATPPATAGQMEPDAAEIASPKAFDALPELLVENYPVGLIVLALAGLVFRSARRPECKAQETRNDSAGLSVGTAAETGVARYLKNLNAPANAAATGVARYLKNLDASAK
jgi:hypothetical protein